jgi:hypothetical protein
VTALQLVAALLSVVIFLSIKVSNFLGRAALGLVALGLLSELAPLCAGALTIMPALFVPTIKPQSVGFSPKLMPEFRMAAFRLDRTPSVKYLTGYYEPLNDAASPDALSDEIRRLTMTLPRGLAGKLNAFPRRPDCPARSSMFRQPCIKIDDGRASQCDYVKQVSDTAFLYYRSEYVEQHLVCGSAIRNSHRAMAVSGGIFSLIGLWIDRKVWPSEWPRDKVFFDYYFSSTFDYSEASIEYVVGGAVTRREAS